MENEAIIFLNELGTLRNVARFYYDMLCSECLERAPIYIIRSSISLLLMCAIKYVKNCECNTTVFIFITCRHFFLSCHSSRRDEQEASVIVFCNERLVRDLQS